MLWSCFRLVFREKPLAQMSVEAVELKCQLGGLGIAAQNGFWRRQITEFSALMIERGEFERSFLFPICDVGS
jgi:hypothetical protein